MFRVRFLSHPKYFLDGNGVKAMPGSIPEPNSGSLWKNKKNTGSQMGQTKKYLKRLKTLEQKDGTLFNVG